MNNFIDKLQNDPQALWRFHAIDSLYERAVKGLEGLDDALAEDDIESSAHHLGEAVEALSFLLEAIDVEAGGEAAEFLHGLYSQILKNLSLVLVSKDREAVQLSGRYLVHLQRLWRERVLAAASNIEHHEDAMVHQGSVAEGSPRPTCRL